MLTEIKNVRQIDGEFRRRWFTSEHLDLVVWCDSQDRPSGFQFCFDKGGAERALTWRLDSGFVYTAVDDGERVGELRYKATPILVADGIADRERMMHLFIKSSSALPTDIAEFAGAKISEYCKNK